ADSQVGGAAYGLLGIGEAGSAQGTGPAAAADVLLGQAPNPAQEALGAFHTGVGPFQAHVRRRGKHHEQPAGIGAVLVDHRLRVDAIVLRLRHLLGTADDHRLAIAAQASADDLALGVPFDIDLGGVVPGLGALGVDPIVGVRQDHALGQQVLEGFVRVDHALVAHQPVDEAGIQQVQDGVLDTTDVLVYR